MIDRKALLLRKKLLGAMLRRARVSAGKNLTKTANQIGTTSNTLSSYEHGRKAASLPEIELFAYHLDIPVSPFLDPSPETGDERPSVDSPMFRKLRDRAIGASLRERRKEVGLTIRQLAERTDMPTKRITAYELGRRSIPLPDLETLAAALGRRIQSFLETEGPVGEWMSGRNASNHVREFPSELREFLSQPENQRYILLAMQLSQLPPERLRAVAESLLEIAR
ncbi:MAG: helix-turn-helix transcriptional regulator [Anaerolineales bacterium]|jgi:transcriptional regulator with XRE-family HTH domain